MELFVYSVSMTAKERLVDLAVSLAVIALFALASFSGLPRLAGYPFYDLLLRVRTPTPAAKEILLVDVDDRAVKEAGAWPWSRAILADGLVLMKELDASYAVFELPFAQNSPNAINSTALGQRLPDAFDREFSRIEENIQTLFDAIRRGSVRPADAPRYISELVGLVGLGKTRLLDELTGIARDDDTLLAQATEFFGGTYVAVELLPSPDVSVDKEVHDIAVRKLSLQGVTVDLDDPPVVRAIRPPVLPILRAAKGGGFLGSVVDPDGARRRALLTVSYAGLRFGQVAFAALRERIGNPQIDLGGSSVVLRATAQPAGGSLDLTIPLTKDGHMLLDWPRVKSGDGFRHVSWGALARHGTLEESLLAALADMERAGYISYLRSESSPLELYEYASRLRSDMLTTGDPSSVQEWRDTRSRFFDLTDRFLNGDAEGRILEDADKALASDRVSTEEKADIQQRRERVAGVFAGARQVFSDLQSTREALKRDLSGSFCIVNLATSLPADAGESASAGAAEPASFGAEPSDLARTPFGAITNSASASAALVNTILSGRFLREVFPLDLLVIGIVLSIIASLASLWLRPLPAAVMGGLFFTAILIASAGLFVFSGSFANPTIPALAAFSSCAAQSVAKRLRIGRRKHAAVRESPRRPAQRRNVTVLAARARHLQIAADSIEPPIFAIMVSSYHARMGKVIAAHGGEIVRAAGGTLTAVFGSREGSSAHARDACRAALALKEAEKALDADPSTRIGIDTGECIVGDLGGAGRVLSVMGRPADVSERLEALSAGYGSSIVVTEAVRAAAGADLVTRRLDRRRFPGGADIVQIVELVCEKARADRSLLAAMDLFDRALVRYENKEWRQAEEVFRRVLALLPSDGPSAVYLERCAKRQGGASPDASA